MESYTTFVGFEKTDVEDTAPLTSISSILDTSTTVRESGIPTKSLPLPSQSMAEF
jgi:hypothetical protein